MQLWLALQARPILAAALAVTSLVLPSARAAAQHSVNAPGSTGVKAVVELFTSQGCSSCPPADLLMKGFAQRQDLVALSLPVDYWDHLGWKDTLASPRFTARQYAYAHAMGTGNVYTPQVVVDGIADAVGSNAAMIEHDIDVAVSTAGSRLAISGRAEGNKLTVEIGAVPASAAAALPAEGTVWLAMVDARVDVVIERGENRGHTLSYYNVVRDMQPVGMWSGKPVTLELPFGASVQAGKRCAVWVQSGDAGRIVGAAWIASDQR